MRFARRHRRPVIETVIDITSLVDVVFLLLIFLLVTTTFKSREYAFPLALPTATETELVLRAERPTIFVSREGQFFLLEIPDDGADPADPADPIDREELERRLARFVEREPDAEISIKAEGGTNYQRFVDVLDACRKVGIEHVLLPYELASEFDDSGGEAAE